MKHLIDINEHSKTPKYVQIINSILTGIEKGELAQKEKLPSVNRLLIDFDISRDTVVKAYDILKQMDIIESVPGKGYYIKRTDIRRKAKIFLLFNKLSVHKKIIYDSFVNVLGEDVAIDFFIYNNNYRLFKQWILENLDSDYSHFVIIAHFLDGGKDVIEVINQIPKHKLILLDKKLPGIEGEYGAVYQDFANDIYNALSEAKDLLSRYRKLKIIFPADSYHPKEILSGFRRFCAEFAFDYDIVRDISSSPIESRDAYINLMEDDLIVLIKRLKALGMKVGQEVGVISYNDTPLKEILLDGITVISTDFQQLGETAAQLILDNRKDHVINPFYLVQRQSL
jgi:DNA-binding transcriptional regulator YhcF (GntR family)